MKPAENFSERKRESLCAITATLFQTSRLCRILSSTFHFFSHFSLILSLSLSRLLHTHLALGLSFFHFNRHRSVYSSLSPCTLPSTTLNGLLSRYAFSRGSPFSKFSIVPPFLSFLFSCQQLYITRSSTYLSYKFILGVEESLGGDAANRAIVFFFPFSFSFFEKVFEISMMVSREKR